MGCPERVDTRENNSSLSLEGSNVSQNITLTQRLTSGRLDIIPPVAPKTERVTRLTSCPIRLSTGYCGQGGSTPKTLLQFDWARYPLTIASSTRFGSTRGS